MKIFVRHLAQKIGQRLAKSFLVPKVKVSTWNILMTLPKNAQEPNLPPQNSTVIAITIAATTFMVNPLSRYIRYHQSFVKGEELFSFCDLTWSFVVSFYRKRTK